ncbi:site-specific integrase [Aeromonas veronii]|uniref:site-specific integrase n=1 Tax=Aeromonas veronii TaxID=654 RepID=UPI000EB1E5CC|nr:site-specific integrase [Aeromonas veronii]AYK20463.1 site-specific integrase [Aeromonas veronii]
MATTRIDGARASDSLIERINTEDGVGEGLAQRTREDYARKMGMIANQIEKAGRGALTPASLVSHLQELVAKKRVAQSTARSLKAAAIFWIAEEAERTRSGRKPERVRSCLQDDPGTADPRATNANRENIKHQAQVLPEGDAGKPLGVRGKHPAGQARRDTGRLSPRQPACRLAPGRVVRGGIHELLAPREGGALQPNGCGRVQSTIALRVENAKTTHGRGNGDHREILLHGISDSDLAALMHFREIAQSFASKFAADTPRSAIAKAFFKPLQQTMTHALKRMGHPKNQLPTTYSTRHQAVANAKHSGLSDREIAAMFGHSSTATAKSHYGKTERVDEGVVSPIPESVAAVPERNANRDLATPASAFWMRQPSGTATATARTPANCDETLTPPNQRAIGAFGDPRDADRRRHSDRQKPRAYHSAKCASSEASELNRGRLEKCASSHTHRMIPGKRTPCSDRSKATTTIPPPSNHTVTTIAPHCAHRIATVSPHFSRKLHHTAYTLLAQ